MNTVGPGTIVVLGGYGNAGRAIAASLLAETTCGVVIAGRRGDRAEAAARKLAERFGPGRVTSAVMDAADAASLALDGVDLIIAASSTAGSAGALVQAAMDHKTDCLDLQYSRAKLDVLRDLAPSIDEAGCCVISDGGAWPGIPAVLVRALAARIKDIRQARVYTLARIDWASREIGVDAVEELLGGLVERPTRVFRHGAWAPLRLAEVVRPVSIDFGPPFGPHYCVPRWLEEMRALPGQFPTLTDTGAYLASPRRVAHWLAGLAGLMSIGSRSRTRAMARALAWIARRSAAAPYGLKMRAEASGTSRAALTLYHEDSYAFTAAAVTACLLQYLDGTIRRPGLWMQAHVVDPERLLRDMARMGVAVDLVAAEASPRP